MAGYSGTPLVKKLGIKPGFSIMIKNPPMQYDQLVADLPADVTLVKAWRKELDFIHLFATESKQIKKLIDQAREYVASNGMIWVSWPKKASKVSTDITEDTIRNHALTIDLVDVKVCAVNEVWSGLKLVIRKEKRR
ncbi:MAG: DUF3052 family protein [Leptospiraceae bacterium]|nr:DUF3052 family protein [Leptospiraceae bacterium]